MRYEVWIESTRSDGVYQTSRVIWAGRFWQKSSAESVARNLTFESKNRMVQRGGKIHSTYYVYDRLRKQKSHPTLDTNPVDSVS